MCYLWETKVNCKNNIYKTCMTFLTMFFLHKRDATLAVKTLKSKIICEEIKVK